jgi:hypothetical protein
MIKSPKKRSHGRAKYLTRFHLINCILGKHCSLYKLGKSLLMVKEKAMKNGLKLSLDINDVPVTLTADERKLKCRLSDYSTPLIFTYFVYQSGCVFRSERAPIGIGNGTLRSW